uniref:Peptidase S1 domain-containing protein n=1 Tax=Monopterus albus TaxID=43700 RepID=A0A3Q3J304_MONAL
MAKHDPNDTPPPYFSIAAYTQPPLPRYGEATCGVAPGLIFPTQPCYIPQHPPSYPQVAQSNVPPSRKKNKCCECNAQCFRGSGGGLLICALIAVAIWLSVRYGTRLIAVILQNDDHITEEPPVPKYETCPNTTVQCNGIRDCKLGTDETICVRFGEGSSLWVRTSKFARFLPVCYQGWDQSYADHTCAQLGFRKSFATKAIQSNESIGLTVTQRPSLPIQGLIKNSSSSCPGQEIVSLQCVDCGQQKSSSRIIGGTVAKIGRWPWQVSLHFRSTHVCGGVLIAPDFVVTAAHCFPSLLDLVVSQWKVYAGVVSQVKLPQPYLVKKILLNTNFNNNTKDADIALLKLSSPVVFDDKAQPACLPIFNQQFNEGTTCWTTGFGTTVAGTYTASNDLMEVNVNIIDTQECNKPHIYGGAVTKSMLCAGDLKGGKDSCQGDSGGPLVCMQDNRWYLVGITSWGDGCGEKNKPGVYTKITSVLPWIASSMQQERP